MWLLAIYAVLVLVSEALSVGLLFIVDRFSHDAANVVFMTALLAGFILPWPLAVRLTDGWEE